MKGALRFLAWATPLTWLATTFYLPYVRFLARLATSLFAMVGIEMRVAALEMLAPVDLALFAALALSSFTTPWPLRLARLGLGLGILFVLEIALVVGGVVLFMMVGVSPSSPVRMLFQNAVGLIGLAGAPALWIILFKPRQLLSLLAPPRMAAGPDPDRPDHPAHREEPSAAEGPR